MYVGPSVRHLIVSGGSSFPLLLYVPLFSVSRGRYRGDSSRRRLGTRGVVGSYPSSFLFVNYFLCLTIWFPAERKIVSG